MQCIQILLLSDIKTLVHVIFYLKKLIVLYLNAGDGSREHPTQALLDALTIINRKEKN